MDNRAGLYDKICRKIISERAENKNNDELSERRINYELDYY
jgi:hypothetical protein